MTGELDAHSAWLRDLRCLGQPLLNAVYGAVRDPDWNTVLPDVRVLETHRDGACTTTLLECHARALPVDFKWQTRVTLAPTRMTYTFSGEALADFDANRVGLCALHGLWQAGAAVVADQDGLEVRGGFPELIAPHPVFTDLRGLRFALPDGTPVNVQFFGDLFETEDQRNWGDASFKTYCTPLHLKSPRQFKRGDRVEQRLEITVQASPTARHSSPPDEPVAAWRASPLLPLPALGIALPEDLPAQPTALRGLAVHHLRLAVRADGLWRARLEVLRTSGVPLELAVHDAGQLNALKQRLEEGVPVARVLLFDAAATTVNEARAAFPGIPVLVGSDANFAEANRATLPPADGACFSLNPQVHAFDDRTLFECLETIPALVRSARAKGVGDRVAITPLSLKPRFNAVATRARAPSSQPVPDNADARQVTRLAGAWLLGMVAALTESGCDSATVFETHGWRGVQGGGVATFGLEPDALFPVHGVLQALCATQTSVQVWRASGCVAVRLQSHVWIANLTHRALTLEPPRAWNLPVAQLQLPGFDFAALEGHP